MKRFLTLYILDGIIEFTLLLAFVLFLVIIRLSSPVIWALVVLGSIWFFDKFLKSINALLDVCGKTIVTKELDNKRSLYRWQLDVFFTVKYYSFRYQKKEYIIPVVLISHPSSMSDKGSRMFLKFYKRSRIVLELSAM